MSAAPNICHIQTGTEKLQTYIINLSLPRVYKNVHVTHMHARIYALTHTYSIFVELYKNNI